MHNKFLPALIFLALFFFSLSVSHAQTMSFYSFNLPDAGAASTPFGIINSSATDVLTMDCLAANGYGLWTSTSNSTNPTSHAACLLLSNTLNTVTSVTEAQFGDLGAMRFSYNPGDGYPTEAIKCAANLNGNVRYVWLDNTSGRDNFYVEGFDPATSTNATSGIGIDFVGLGQPTVGVNSANILKNTGSPFPTATFYTESVMTVGSVVTSTNETLYPDMFDVAIDASNLYIVWEEDVLGVFSIHAAAVNLSTSAVTQLGTVGNGRRPTVSIDVRTSGGSAADIDVAYLTSVPGSINWAEWNGTTWITLPVPTLVTGTATSWSNATHARIVDASNPGQGTTDKAIYFIAEDHSSGKVSLFFNRITTPGGLSLDCTYCDGTLITTQRPSGSPIATSGGFAVKDDYIRAFANPYDGANSPFDEFHCLYVLIISPTLTPPAMGALPLMIINGTNSATGFCVSGDNTGGSFPYYDPDQVLPPPTVHVPINYQAAVNQMGFNVYWTGGAGTRLYHRRYERPFDQCITENTLITGACEVSQAISPYTVTLKNNFLTLFSDPTFFSSGPPVIDGSGYMGSGQLTIDDGVILDINPSTDGGGDFVELGCSTIAFSGSPTSQAILEVDALDQMDFYGNAHSTVEGGGEFHFVGAGDNDFSSAYGSYVSTITDPATLNIHGGTVLDVGNSSFGSSYFTSTDAEIHANFERSVLSGTGSSTSGKLMLNDHSSFTTSVIISDDPNAGDNPTILWIAWNGTAVVLPGPGTGNANYNSLTPTFATDTFEECHFTTSGNTGHATVAVAGNLYVAPNALIVDNGFIEGVSFDSKSGNAISPYWPIIFTDVTFRRVVQYGMDFWLNTQPTGFATNTEYSLLVNGCGFEGFDDFANFPNPDGIKVEAAPDVVTPMTEPTGPEDALRQDITIENNTFESAIYFDDGGEGDGGEGDFTIGSAIHFSDATGDIIGNDISGAKYKRGIWNESASAASHDLTWTFMCTNNIHSIAYDALPDLGVGISTDYSTGYIKSDTVYYCEIGQLSGSNDYFVHIDFSGYAHNYGPALSDTLGGIVDMTGVHHPGGGGDDPGYNIFKYNNSGGAQITTDGVSIVYLGHNDGTMGGPSWTIYGSNDIEGSPDDITNSSATVIDFGDVSDNYWGGSSMTAGADISFSDPSDIGSSYTPRSFTCSADDASRRKGSDPLSIESNDTTGQAACSSLWSRGIALEEYGDFQNSYDTLRMFIQSCPLTPNGWNAFGGVNADVSGWSAGGAGRWPDFLSWLKQVLYLNPDTMWYCADVNDMITALQNDEAGQEAATQYILQSGKCPAFTGAFQTLFNSSSHWRHQFWLDSIVDNYDTVQPWGIYQWWVDSLVNKDTLANPYDSTIPSLQQENLQILLGPQFANSVGASSPITSQALLSAQLLENPMQNEIDISYDMGRTALVTMELRDVLGRSVPIANAKYQLEQPGDHTATLPAPNLPAGTYYLHITTDVGDAITLKIVKE